MRVLRNREITGNSFCAQYAKLSSYVIRAINVHAVNEVIIRNRQSATKYLDS